MIVNNKNNSLKTLLEFILSLCNTQLINYTTKVKTFKFNPLETI